MENDGLYHRSSVMGGTMADRETNTRYYAGPEVKEVSGATGRDFKPVEVEGSRPSGQRAMREGRTAVYVRRRKQAMSAGTVPLTGEIHPFSRIVHETGNPARYDRAPAERQMQVNNTPVQNPESDQPSGLSAPRSLLRASTRTIKDRKPGPVAAPAKKTEAGGTELKAKPAEKKPAGAEPGNRTRPEFKKHSAKKRRG
ncbi:MAG: hypothetical protein MZV63_55790 [Marinilabiliales bacterium]|nr:hypothetical protein [Marinilabiliales bacterium]